MNPGIPLFRDSPIVRVMVSNWVSNWWLIVNWHRGTIYLTTNISLTVLHISWTHQILASKTADNRVPRIIKVRL